MAVDEPAWPELKAALHGDPGIVVLPVTQTAGQDCLHRLQVTARSYLGALALHTGGLLVDHGWLRVLGGGSERGLPSLAHANQVPAGTQSPPPLLVGHDVLGGRFEVNGRDPAAVGRPGEPGDVCYFAPDSLEWEGLSVGHAGWLTWIAAGGHTAFYESLRWPGWQEETRELPLTHGIAVQPVLWSHEARRDLAATHRRPVPMHELFVLQQDFAATLATLPDGTAVQIDVT